MPRTRTSSVVEQAADVLPDAVSDHYCANMHAVLQLVVIVGHPLRRFVAAVLRMRRNLATLHTVAVLTRSTARRAVTPGRRTSLPAMGVVTAGLGLAEGRPSGQIIRPSVL